MPDGCKPKYTTLPHIAEKLPQKVPMTQKITSHGEDEQELKFIADEKRPHLVPSAFYGPIHKEN